MDGHIVMPGGQGKSKSWLLSPENPDSRAFQCLCNKHAPAFDRGHAGFSGNRTSTLIN